MKLKIEYVTPGFFAIPLKKVAIEDPGTGRVYFLHKDRIVAVAQRMESPQ